MSANTHPKITRLSSVRNEGRVDDTPTRLVQRILKPLSPHSEMVNAVDEDASATMAVMLRVQDRPRSLLMITREHRERLRLALHAVGFKVTVAFTKEHALELIAARHHALAVTDSLDIMKSLHDLGTERLLQIILITDHRALEMEAALRAGADECLDRNSSATLLQARFTAARRAGDLESALRSALIEGTRLATIDELTGVANRRFFASNYPREISRAARYGHPIAIAMCDIDHFKRINDQFGHPAGDVVLQQFTQRILKCLRRGTDWIARLGGEEFAVVLPETSLDQGLSVFRKLREAISTEPFCSGTAQMAVTASFGVAGIESVPRNPKDLAERLLRAADRALYHCKEKGRDRVVGVKLKYDCR